MNRKPLGDEPCFPEHNENRFPFQEIAGGHNQPKKPSMFTKIKNEITHEKHAFRENPKQPSNSQDYKQPRNYFSSNDSHNQNHNDSHRDLSSSTAKFGYEDIMKERNFHKRENIRLQSQLRAMAEEKRELVSEIVYLRDIEKAHTSEIARKNKEGRAVEDFYEMLRKENERLEARNRELDLLNTSYLLEIAGMKDLAKRIDCLEEMNEHLLEQLKAGLNAEDSNN